MSNLRYAWAICLYNFRRWSNLPRVVSILFLLIAIVLIYINPFVENAKQLAHPLQLFEPFIALLNSRFSMLIFSSIIVLLFCDIPITDELLMKCFVTGTRRMWFIGQWLYVLIASVLFACIIACITFFAVITDNSIANQWSHPVMIMAIGRKVLIEEVRIAISRFMVNFGSPYLVFLHTYFLLILLSCFYGTISLCLNLYKRSSSIVILVLMNLLDWSASMFMRDEPEYIIISWLSPHYHASFIEHATDVVVSPPFPSISMSYIVLSGMITVLFLASVLSIKRHTFFMLKEV